MAVRLRHAVLLALLLLTLLLSTASAAENTAPEARDITDDDLEMDPMPDVGDIPIDDDDEEDDDEEDDEEDDETAPDPEPVADTPAVIDPETPEGEDGLPTPSTSGALFYDGFQSGLTQWAHTKDASYTGEFKVGQGAKPTFKGDRALIIPEKARKYAISARVAGMENMEGKDLVLQYELKLDQGMTCGGAYMKLPTAADFDPEAFNGETPYSIMFGPDRCGATDKVFFIVQAKNPATGKLSEHQMKEPPSVANSFDKKTHLYTISVKVDGSIKLLIDGEVKKEGTMADMFDPPIQPPAEISDPDDKKPVDWVDTAKISDPEAKKPEEWDEDAPMEIEDTAAVKPEGWLDDEPSMVPDPEAKKPDEWDDEEDGEWKATDVPNPKCEAIGCGEWNIPMKTNPDYKGKWTAPMIDNPKYLGVWKPRSIPNKEYYDASNVRLLPIHGLGFEIWTMDQGVLFDNIWLGTDIAAAKKYADESYVIKQKTELVKEEAANKKAEEEAKKSGMNKKAGTASKIPYMDKIQYIVDKLDMSLQPIEDWLAEVGAEPYLDIIMDAGFTKPMYIVISIPLVIVLLFIIILGGGKKATPAPTPDAERKKTDESTADDSTTTTDAVEGTDEPAGSEGPEKPTTRKRRSAVQE